MKLYKILDQQGRPRYQGSFQWPMPKDGEPGDWMDVGSGQRLALCSWGLHGYRTMQKAQAEINQPSRQLVYEMEVDTSAPFIDDASYDGRDKVCCQRARILRAVADKDGPLIMMADYIWQ